MTEKEVINILGFISEYYGTDLINDIQIAIWLSAFKDYSYKEVFRAVKDFIINDNRDYLKVPGPGQVKKYIKRVYKIDNEGWIV